MTGVKPLDPRLLRHAATARVYLALTVGLGLASAVLILGQATLLADILPRVFLDRAPLAKVTGPMALLAAVLLGRAGIAWAGEVAAHLSSARVKSQLRAGLLRHAVALGPAWLARERSGELAALATRGVDALDGYFARYLPQLVLALLVPVAVLARVVTTDWLSAVTIAVILPLIPVFMALIGISTQRRTQRQWSTLSTLAGHFLDVVEGLPTLRIFGRAKAQAAAVRRITNEYRIATMATLRIAFLSALVLELLSMLAVALVAVSVGLRLVDGRVTLHTALLVLLLAPEAYLPVRQVGAQFHASMEGVTAAERVFAVLETSGPDRSATSVRPPAAVPDLRAATVSVEAVWFTWPARDVPALAEVSLGLHPGERLALVGDSGAGKSSLVSLLLGFTRPQQGRITVGGTDLADLPLVQWRRQLAWVSQRPYLFAASIADNIRLGEPDAALEAVRQAARLANAAEFVESLPAAYDTVVGERGVGLSAGQRQRIALARAFLRDAPVLLLDEPTANLDADSAAAVQDALERLMAGRTVLLVVHRLALARGADRIVVMSAGRVVEVGTPAELDAVQGPWSALVAAAGPSVGATGSAGAAGAAGAVGAEVSG